MCVWTCELRWLGMHTQSRILSYFEATFSTSGGMMIKSTYTVYLARSRLRYFTSWCVVNMYSFQSHCFSVQFRFTCGFKMVWLRPCRSINLDLSLFTSKELKKNERFLWKVHYCITFSWCYRYGIKGQFRNQWGKLM